MPRHSLCDAPIIIAAIANELARTFETVRIWTGLAFGINFGNENRFQEEPVFPAGYKASDSEHSGIGRIYPNEITHETESIIFGSYCRELRTRTWIKINTKTGHVIAKTETKTFSGHVCDLLIDPAEKLAPNLINPLRVLGHIWHDSKKVFEAELKKQNNIKIELRGTLGRSKTRARIPTEMLRDMSPQKVKFDWNRNTVRIDKNLYSNVIVNVGYQASSAALDRRDRENIAVEYLVKIMNKDPYKPGKQSDLKKIIADRVPLGEREFLRVWKKALIINKEHYPNTHWTRRGPRSR